MSLNAFRRSAPGAALAGRPRLRIARGDDGHRAHHQRGAKQPRQHAGRKQLADVRFGDDAVDHHDRRRRDHDAQRAAGGDDAGGQVVGVAELLHRRIRHLAHRGRGGDRRAADGAEPGAGQDRGVRQPATHVPDQRVRQAEQFVREARARDEVAHQDEQRHHAQRVGEAGFVDHLAGRGRGGVPAAQQAEADEAHDTHRKGQRQAQQRQHEDAAEAEQGLGHDDPSASTPTW